jgi:hypothetical protein
MPTIARRGYTPQLDETHLLTGICGLEEVKLGWREAIHIDTMSS